MLLCSKVSAICILYVLCTAGPMLLLALGPKISPFNLRLPRTHSDCPRREEVPHNVVFPKLLDPKILGVLFIFSNYRICF